MRKEPGEYSKAKLYTRLGLAFLFFLLPTLSFQSGKLDFQNLDLDDGFLAIVLFCLLTGFLATWKKLETLSGYGLVFGLWLILTLGSLQAIIDPQPGSGRRIPDTEEGVRVVFSMIFLIVNVPVVIGLALKLKSLAKRANNKKP